MLYVALPSFDVVVKTLAGSMDIAAGSELILVGVPGYIVLVSCSATSG